MNHDRPPSWLVICFPTVLAAIIGFGYFRPTRELLRLRQTYAEKTQHAGAAFQVQTVRNEVEARRLRLAAETASRMDLVARWTRLSKRATESMERSAALEAVAQTLLRHELQVVEKAPALAAVAPLADEPLRRLQQKLAQPLSVTFPVLRTLAEDLPEGAAGNLAPPVPNGPQVWTVDCIGSYGNMQAALAAFATLDESLTVLRIEMSPADPTTPQRRWKITLAF